MYMRVNVLSLFLVSAQLRRGSTEMLDKHDKHSLGPLPEDEAAKSGSKKLHTTVTHSFVTVKGPDAKGKSKKPRKF